MLKERIKRRIDSVSYFLKSVFVAAKGSDSLSLHQKTVTISIWIIVILTLSAVLIEGCSSDNHWLTFAENLMIGIVCSAFVVVVTVFLQFKAEQENRIKEHNSALYHLLSCIKVCLTEDVQSRGREDYLLDSLFRECDSYYNDGLGICWYSAEKSQQYFDVILKVLPLTIPVVRRRPIQSLTEYRSEIPIDDYNLAVAAAITFSADYVLGQSANRFESLTYEVSKDS